MAPAMMGWWHLLDTIHSATRLIVELCCLWEWQKRGVLLLCGLCWFGVVLGAIAILAFKAVAGSEALMLEDRNKEEGGIEYGRL